MSNQAKEIKSLKVKDLKSGIYFYNDFSNTSCINKCSFNIKEHEKIVLQINIKNIGKTKAYNINFNQSINSSVDIIFKIIANKSSSTNIAISNNVGNNTNCIISQDIEGVILDESSTIKILPIMNVSTNKINASHSVNIGHIDKEKLFYLTSRGIDKQNAIKLLLTNLFNIQ
jgi:hypothetical protein